MFSEGEKGGLVFINSLCYTRFTKMITGKNDSGTVTEKTLSDKLLQSMSDQIPMFVAIGLLLIPIDGGDQSEVKETNHRFYSISPLRPYCRVDAHGSQFDDDR